MENLKNLFPFYKGQKVAAKKDIKSSYLKRNEIVTVDILVNCICKQKYFSHGKKHNYIGQLNWNCTKCNRNINMPDTSYFYELVENFIPIEESPFPKLTLKQVIKKENILVGSN